MRVTDEMVARLNEYMWLEPYTREVLEIALAHVTVTDEMCDIGCDAMLAFRKSGGDWTDKPHHAVRAVLEAVLHKP